MSIPALVCFLTGLVMEALWLAANAGWNRSEKWLRKTLLAEGAIFSAGGAITAGCYIFSWDKVNVSLDDGWVGWIFVVIGLVLLGAGLVAPKILPRVSERSILVVELMVMVSLLQGGRDLSPIGILIGGVAPIGVTVWMLLSKNTPKPILRVFLYFFYLVLLVAQTVLSGQLALFSDIEISLLEGFSFGAVFFFIILHGLFLVRFFMIVTSLVLPRNRRLAGEAMQKLYYEDYTPAWQFGLFALTALGATWLVGQFNLPMPGLWVNLFIMLAVQVVFNPRLRGNKESKPVNESKN